jgi:hypothetical protein
LAKHKRGSSPEHPHQKKASGDQVNCAPNDDPLENILVSLAINEQSPGEYSSDEMSRIEAKLDEFFPGIAELACSAADEVFLRGLTLQAFVRPGTDPSAFDPDAALTGISVPERLIDELVSEVAPTRQIDRLLLKEDLRLCTVCYQLQSSLDSGDTSKRSIDELYNIKPLATDLRRYLKSDLRTLGLDWFVYAPNGVPEFEFEDLIKQLDRLIEKVEWQLRFTPEKPLLKGPLSPIERLVGVNLPIVFRRHYGEEPGRGERGPFVRFVSRILSAAQMPRLAPATIKKYVINAAKGQSRRKAAKIGGVGV